jgi:SAM-dependent methyltransferase
MTNMAHNRLDAQPEHALADNALEIATSQTRARWDRRYREGVTPWDTQITPPEVIDFWQSSRLPRAGVALDLGCGPGTNLRYLAGLGLIAIGVEIASAPLLIAAERIGQDAPTLRTRIHFVCSDVCQLPFVGLDAGYILDIGCFHSLPRAVRQHYVNNVVANIAPGGYYHLYAFDTDPQDAEPASGPPGVDPGEVSRRFAPALEMVEEVIARPDRRPCRWYLLRRPL